MSRRPTDAAAFPVWRLHDRHVLDSAGCPVMPEAAITYMDRPRHTAPTVTRADVDAAFARLTAESPTLAAAVRLCYIEGHTMRQAAGVLGVTVRTVHVRCKQGAAQMALWLALPSAEAIEDVLRRKLSTLH